MTSIIQFADIHFGVEDKDAMAALAAMVKLLKPDVTVICGDITQNGKKDEFYAARDWIRTLPGPKVITPGNHDTPMFGLLQRVFDPFGRYNRIIAPLTEPHYTDQYVSIMPLNTSRGWQAKTDWSLGVVDMAELSGVTRDLKAVSSSTVKMIAVHHPLIYPSSSPLQKETENGADALKHLSEENIDAVLSGHVHAPFMLERQPDETEIMSIGSGTLSVRRRDKPASFNHLSIDGETLSITEIFWNDGRYQNSEPWIKKISELKSQRSD
ncbi:metallophosphoesterase family protein [Hellea balneolensis]|uniref:metallophosphoesterase family protein n=1 Tax=Hellea balneolensis TaxID=287478 RepID=UPI000415FCC4|nr:metallophosphoesterase [Hellea balneolensis]